MTTSGWEEGEETLVDHKLKTDRNLKIKILHIYIEKSYMYIFKFILGLHKNVIITSVVVLLMPP